LSIPKKENSKFKKPIKNKRNIDLSLRYYSHLDGSIKSAKGSFNYKNPKIYLDKKPYIF